MLNFLKVKEYHQTSFVIIGNQIIFLVCLFYFNNLWFLAIPAMYLVGFFWEASLHQYFAHNSYITDSIRIRLLLIMSFLVGQGSILSWSNVHRHHHRWVETEKDPHSPFYVSSFRIGSSFLQNKCSTNYVKNLLKSDQKKYLLFENKYYWLMWIVLWTILYLLHPILLFFLVSGAALWWWSVTLVNILSHKKILGYSPDPTGIATNSKIINIITGIGNHYNHHRYPAGYKDKIRYPQSIYDNFIKLLFVK